MTVVTRFAPSPTGPLHIGGARTALYAWLHARRHGGQFILRFEDTDRERSTEAYARSILESMTWLGLHHHQGPYHQSQRMARYGEVVQQLLGAGLAYHCYCTVQELDEMRAMQRQRHEKPRYDGRCRTRAEPRDGVSPVVRFCNPTDGEVVFCDLTKGTIAVANAELDDLILVRSDGQPTYNLCVVVDDLDMGVTHVIRGEDHVINTPRQINLFAALGATPPQYAHVPLIMGADGKPLSKRHAAVDVLAYREQGYLPAALLNYLFLLGYSVGDQERFTLQEMAEVFDLARVHRSSAVFDPKKLTWLNHQHIKESSPEHLAPLLLERLAERGCIPGVAPPLAEVVRAQQERCKTLAEMADKSLFFYAAPTGYAPKAVERHFSKPHAAGLLATLRQQLEGLPQWSQAAIDQVIHETATSSEAPLADVAQPLRLAMSGDTVSPPIDVTLFLLGRDETLQRLDAALAFVHHHNTASPGHSAAS
jgi:glutamyl-tRNA synthetase